MSALTENWYVYYAAPSDATALARVRAMQRLLTGAGAARTRLEERVAPEKPTWMEVYEGIDDPESFAATLAAALAASGLPELVGVRRIERFRCL